MFSIIPALSLVLAATSASAGLVSPHHRALAHQARATQPAGWATGYLEDYQTYHARYLAIDCEAKHNTTYFDKCCHPMLATENLKDDRAPDCAPNATALASASAAYATSTVTTPNGTDDDDCDDEPESAAATPAPSPSSSKKAAAAAALATPKSPESSSSSSKKADTTTSSQKAAASSSSSKKADATTTSSSKKAVATSSSSSSSSGSLASLVQQVFSGGVATFFTQNGVAGACGKVNPDSAIIAALDTAMYANGAHCGKFIQVLNKATGATQKVQVADECPTCGGSTSVDFSEGAFKALGGTVEEGEFDIEWGFLN